MGIIFNGSNQYFSHGNNTSLEYNTPFSFTAWVKFEDTNNYNCVLSKNNNASPYRGWIWAIRGGAGGGVYNSEIKIINSFSGNTLMNYDSNALAHSTLHHVAVTYSGNQDVSGTSFYTNGVKSGAKTTVYNSLSGSITNSANLLSGNASPSLGQYFQGLIFDARIYNRQLSDAEVLIIAKSEGNDKITTGLQGYLRMNEQPDGQTASTIIDLSVNGYNGSVVGSPTYAASRLKII